MVWRRRRRRRRQGRTRRPASSRLPACSPQSALPRRFPPLYWWEVPVRCSFPGQGGGGKAATRAGRASLGSSVDRIEARIDVMLEWEGVFPLGHGVWEPDNGSKGFGGFPSSLYPTFHTTCNPLRPSARDRLDPKEGLPSLQFPPLKAPRRATRERPRQFDQKALIAKGCQSGEGLWCPSARPGRPGRNQLARTSTNTQVSPVLRPEDIGSPSSSLLSRASARQKKQIAFRRSSKPRP